MDITSVFEIVAGARDLANAARLDGNANRDKRQARQVKSIIEALRLIYFSPRGVISLLSDIVEGVYPTEEQIEFILPRFNDAEPFVERMLWRLDPDVGPPNGVLTLKAERVLREISYGKGGVREKVKDMLNHALTYGEPISAERAAKLRGEIFDLNLAIEEAEEALVASTRGSFS